jgi:hypothetical protein
MVMTARQAEKKICPFKSSAFEQAKCVADNCPLWRWADPDLMILKEGSDPNIKAGYCGAGVRPEVYRIEEF